MRDKYGCLVNQRSTLFCYDQSGTLLWQHHCSTVESFSFAVPDKQSCYAISSVIDSQAYALYSNESIGIQDAVLLQMPDDAVYTSFFLTDSNHLIAAGKTIGSLYIYIW